MMIDAPKYPAFRPFTVQDKSWYEEYYNLFDPYADFCYSNLLTWLNINDDLCIAELNGNLIFRFTDVFSRNPTSPSISVLGASKADETLSQLLATSAGQHEITMLPECFTDNLSALSSQLVDNRDNWDYLYDVQSFVALDGPDYRRLRYQINSYKKDTGPRTNICFEKLENKQQGVNIIQNLRDWNRAYQFGNDPEEIENVALQRRVISLEGSGSHVLRLDIDNKTEGFVIFTFPIKQSVGIIHHIKCSYNYDFMFDYLFYETMSYLLRNKIKTLNLEQDLGIQGLREHKLLLRPSGFLKKYCLGTNSPI